ncbi:excalibur calcium-binding protein [Streptomyces sp. NPDC005925]|uniref:excalibur calcium-binding protein n=1 Tax=Streptomyces sp. NPDC005925 TaxID=3157172 RepID=UPI0033CE7FBB
MRRSTGALGTLIALVSAAALAHPAHAQDLDCRDFTYQEEAQAVFDLDTSDPHRLDEEQGPDDGKACEALPRRAGLTSSTTSPSPMTSAASPTTLPTATASPTVPVSPGTATTTLGVRGGQGGSSSGGPSGGDIAVGAVFVVGAALATGFWVRRRRS